MGGDFFSNFWKGGDFVNEFGKPCSRKFIKLFLFRKSYFDALSIGNNIVVLQNFKNPLTKTDAYLYDVKKEK